MLTVILVIDREAFFFIKLDSNWHSR